VKFCCQLLSTTGIWHLQALEFMVARDGVEPPTPAFSDLVQPEPTTAYMAAGDCQVPANTCKTEQSWAGILG